MKSWSRKLHLILEETRQRVEAEKLNIEKLQLKLENLLYKQDYLEREIISCQSLSTTEVDNVAIELNDDLIKTEYSADLRIFHNRSVSKLRKEKIKRIETESVLQELKTKLNERTEVLEKKRKFLDDLPGKLTSVLSIAQDIDRSFADIIV